VIFAVVLKVTFESKFSEENGVLCTTHGLYFQGDKGERGEKGLPVNMLDFGLIVLHEY